MIQSSNSKSLYMLALILCLTVFSHSSRAQEDSASNPLRGFNQIIAELDFKNAELKDVVRLIAKKYQLNLFIEDAIQKRVTLHMANISAIEALEFLAAENNLELIEHGNIIKIKQPTEPPSPPKVWQIDYIDDLLSVDFQDENLQQSMRELSRTTGKTILAAQNANGTISAMVQNLPLEDALQQIASINGLQLRKDGEVFHLARPAYAAGANKASTGIWISIDANKLISLDIQNADLEITLNELSAKTGIGIFLLDKPEGKINGKAQWLTIDKCLSMLLLESNFTYKQSDNVYLVGDKSNTRLTLSRLIELKHLKAEGVIEMLPKQVTDKAELSVIREHNALLVNGAGSVVSEIEDILKRMDKPIPQVFFEVLVVDFTFTDSRDISIEAGLNNPDSSSGFFDGWIPGVDIFWNGDNTNKYLDKLDNFFSGVNIGNLPDDFYLKVRALEQKGKANIRSRPQISTLNGHTAELKVGETRYFKLISETPIRDPSQVLLQTTERFQTVEINISLKITPWVSSSGEITVEIYPEFNTPGEQISPEVPPNIQSRSLSSTVRLRDGETIVLGGLIQEIDSESISRVPLLGRIPLLGRLFSNRNFNKSKSELIIYVTPRLTYGNDAWLNPE
ncbi:MAG: hypothetical protein ACRBF0_15065 [Calditrichia bacterium]